MAKRKTSAKTSARTGGKRKGVVDHKDSVLVRFMAWARRNGVKTLSEKGRGSAKVSTIKRRAEKMGKTIPAEYASFG